MKLSNAVQQASAFLNPLPSSPNLVPLVFEPLPLGSIKPLGWLENEMQLMAHGLAGQEFEFYPYVYDSPWLGGGSEYSVLNEGLPYWFNGIVPLAYGLDDDRLKQQVHDAVTHVLEHQWEDGWLGPESVDYRNLWARFPIMLGFMQLYEADLRYSELLLPAMYKFIDLMHSMLADDLSGYVPHEGEFFQEATRWGRARAHDMMIVLQWLYEKHPPANSKKLLESMRYLLEGALDWSYWFSEGVFIKDDLFNVPGQDEANEMYPFEHGVNLGQGLKAGAVIRRFTYNNSLLDITRQGVNWTFEYHGAASGTILADERINGLAPYYGSELCTVVETMYSLSYLYQAFGDNSFADRCELAAFNALPVQVTSDWWARQYLTQPNQPYSTRLDPNPFFNSREWAQTYTLEGNYPCCTVNFPQGFPKFLSNSFVKVGDDGLAHVLLSPASVMTTIKGADVIVDCETRYPFDNSLEYTIDSDIDFRFHIRVPSWANAEYSSVNVSRPADLFPDSHTGLHWIDIKAGRTYVSYMLDHSIVIEHRMNDTVAVHNGAVLYALEIKQRSYASAPKSFTGDPLTKEMPREVKDWILTNASAWNVAIDVSTLEFHSSYKPLRKPTFSPGGPLVWISAKACHIEWGLFRNSPDIPPPKEQRKCLGELFEAQLVPYGSAKLHMVDLPTIDLSSYPR
ncbi:hypothetical protein M501DRAFT_1019963 [Patellaria atrata CBS 101060]|uniref:Uncharacterized protein n=1 Tax=Patellaria atrata CBS 101060 TaxID=1346257 RepID=A0A9P4S4J8_9PEZI|nr:hypothetical protein M501DRAFT_1019963 [Patellaria atrata CBS 101060]